MVRFQNRVFARAHLSFDAAWSCRAVAPIRASRAASGDRAVHQPGLLVLPAADKLIAEYAQDPSVIALSLAVDYWDYLGWKDTLALSGHSNRQRAYAKARGDRQVYTPRR
jgi:hypothetical protein